MTKFTWRILKCITTNDNSAPPLEVKTIFWQCLAETNEFKCVEYGETQLSEADPDHFIEYTDLTQEQLVEWIRVSMGEPEFQRIQDVLHNKMQNRLHSLISPDLPWNIN